jgi:Ala-tRNA(Pro) deacylase
MASASLPITTEADLLKYLAANQLPYDRIEHPAVFTCAEAVLFRPATPGLETKNLVLRGEGHKGQAPQFFLIVTACEKRLDLKALGKQIGAGKLHFASNDQLMDLLGVEAGSVTILGLVNDRKQQINLLIDAAYWPADAYLCHPLINTATLAIDHDTLLRFLELTGHTPQVIPMPG